MKCNPEDINTNSDQDYKELGQRKIRKKERVARPKKRSKGDSDKEYDRFALKVWEKNKHKHKHKHKLWPRNKIAVTAMVLTFFTAIKSTAS